MTMPDTDTRFDASPEDALAAIAAHRGPIVVDFDETLLLGNSTSLFLESVRPRLLAYLVVKLADLVRPGRRESTGPDPAAWRIRLLLALLPWSRRTWRRRAGTIARELINRPLVDALARADGPVIISTKGFRPVVEPLVAESGVPAAQVVAIDPRSHEDRDEAKLRLTAEALAPDTLDRALVVTDSLVDRALLEASATPLRVQWPQDPPGDPFATTYVPGRYLEVKRPKARFVRKIIKEDLALWILGSVWFADDPIAHVAGLVVLAMSFWAVYEFGYMDNDRVAERHEHDPALSDLYHRRRMSIAPWKPFAFATVSGIAGLWILRWPDVPDPFDYVRWGAVLAVTGSVFVGYNRIDKQTRVLIYPLLQILRLGAYVALVPTTAIADAAMIIMALLRWVSYYVYRTRDRQWPGEDLSVIRLIVFVAASILLASQHEWSDLTSPTTLGLFVWVLFLARHGLPRALASAHRIDRPRTAPARRG